MAISLPDETRKELVTSIVRFFRDEREEEIGELQASILLDFVLMEIGPSIYNEGIRDAQSVLQTVVADLDLTLHEPEFGHSAEGRRERGRSRR